MKKKGEINLRNSMAKLRKRTISSRWRNLSSRPKKEQTSLKRSDRADHDLHSNSRYQFWKVMARPRVQCVSERAISAKFLCELALRLLCFIFFLLDYIRRDENDRGHPTILFSWNCSDDEKSISQLHRWVNKSLSDADRARLIRQTAIKNIVEK